jgi:hypothetical protein
LRVAVLVAALGAGPAAAQAQAATVAGVNAHLTAVDSVELGRQLDLAQELGAKLVRVDVGWPSLQENGPDSHSAWYVAKIDALVAGAESRGIRPVFTFASSPCWASSAPETERAGCTGAWWKRDVMRYGPTDPQDYADALAWLAVRYGDRVAAYEVWNEPNLSSFLKSSDPVREYTALVKAAYRTVKAAAPQATVLAGALQGSDFDFAEQMFKAGLGRDFDGFSIHPYANDAAPDAVLEQYRRYSFVAGPPAVHETLVRNGAGDKKLWLTEAGWSTTPRRNGEPWQNGVDESVQAEYLTRAFEIAASWDYVAAMLWYDLVDEGTDDLDTYDRTGLVRVDGSRRPAFAAFKSVAPAGTQPVADVPIPQPIESAADVPVPQPGEPVSEPIADVALAVEPAFSLTVRKKGRSLLVRGKAGTSTTVQIRLIGKGGKRARSSRRIVVRARANGSYSVRLRARGVRAVKVTATGRTLRRAVR